MNKEMFLQILKDELSNLPEGKLSDILYNYKELFDDGISSGKNEDEISLEIGDPYSIAKTINSTFLKSTEIINKKTNSDTTNKHIEVISNNNSKKNTYIFFIIFIILLTIVLAPPILTMGFAFFSFLFTLIIISFFISASGIGILIGQVTVDNISNLSIPSFILDFPNKSLILIVIGSILLLLFLLMFLFYFLKLLFYLAKKLCCWISNRIRGTY